MLRRAWQFTERILQPALQGERRREKSLHSNCIETTTTPARVVELADTGDLKSPGQMRLCGFESRPGHFALATDRPNLLNARRCELE